MVKQEQNEKMAPAYQNDFEYLEDQFRLVDLILEKRNIAQEAQSQYQQEAQSQYRQEVNVIDHEIRQQLRKIHKRQDCSHKLHRSFSLDKIVEQYRLDPMEKKILIFLLHRYFSSDNQESSGRNVLANITHSRVEMMRSRHYLMENSKLRRNKLILCEESILERTILDLDFCIPEEVISQILGEKNRNDQTSIGKERSYKQYLNLCFSQVTLMEEKADLLSSMRRENTDVQAIETKENIRELGQIRHNIRKMEKAIDDFGKLQESYPIEEVAREYQLEKDEKLILMILLHDSLGLSDSYMGYEGKRLLAVISESENEMIAKRSLLYKKSKLRSNKLIQIESNWSGQNILEAEYFISEKMIRRLLGDSWKQENCFDDEELEEQEDDRILVSLEPRFSFDDVILPENKKKYIEIALSQQIHRDLIFETWGFNKNIPYGNALTMLFSGLPGTGKTMMAEALAHFLNKKLFIANYAQIQNLYVGETEKRIVAAFRKAREEQGVLLWDEADSMFYSRDIARNSWEYRDVNVILQELEKFSGVVILTTNRKIALDLALERRIAVKVEFEMPGIVEREKIWRKLIPKEAPLHENVDFKCLAQKYPVCGGVIKNAILHAARLAAYRKDSCLRMEDFIDGMNMEIENSWDKSQGKIGFSLELEGKAKI